MKTKTFFVCQNCGVRSPKWSGRCYSCGAWDTLVEEVETNEPHKKTAHEHSTLIEGKIIQLGSIDTDGERRMSTGISELDRILGGGIVPGSLILVGGDPGIGKSTLMLQVCAGLVEYSPLYITGEESLQQIKFRSSRIHGVPDSLLLMAETNLEQINYAIEASESGVVIVDSIQSIHSDKIEAAQGSIIQVRECAAALMQTAKKTGKPIFIIGHVTKEGIIAGPKVLEHLVDTVLQFEGEKTYSYRILRALKNRFGSTNEIGIFEMGESGLKQVDNPSEFFLAHRKNEDSGVAIAASIEGTRPILLEVQALVAPTGYAVPQRTTTGFDLRRLNMILAILEKRLGEKFRSQDVFLNIAGGIYLNDPSADLAVAAALLSSLRDEPVDSKTVLVGELGLTGEIRQVSGIEQRINEAQKLGFERIIIPNLNTKKLNKKFEIEILQVERISLALGIIFGG
jgi:DNA repair protein RadA/Sms